MPTHIIWRPATIGQPNRAAYYGRDCCHTRFTLDPSPPAALHLLYMVWHSPVAPYIHTTLPIYGYAPRAGGVLSIHPVTASQTLNVPPIPLGSAPFSQLAAPVAQLPLCRPTPSAHHIMISWHLPTPYACPSHSGDDAPRGVPAAFVWPWGHRPPHPVQSPPALPREQAAGLLTFFPRCMSPPIPAVSKWDPDCTQSG